MSNALERFARSPRDGRGLVDEHVERREALVPFDERRHRAPDAPQRVGVQTQSAAGVTIALAATSRARLAAFGATGVAFAIALLGDAAPGVATFAMGFKCLKTEVTIGVLSGLVVGVRGARHLRPDRVAATCGAGALAAQGAVSVMCHANGGMAHALLFHALGVSAASLFGVALASAWHAIASRGASSNR